LTSYDPKTATQALIADLEVFGAALAQVIAKDGDKEVMLGQAFLVAPNWLATCGHVVDKYAASPQSLVIKFPASDSRYPVNKVKLHPQFARQQDGLVRDDAAVVGVELQGAEKQASPLPIAYGKSMRTHLALYAVRFPVHLGTLTGTPSPLVQVGRLLGPLKKNDNMHLLHDLALSPGDSGSALFDGESVVALHCGDTASLPGLNLPTTSIRLALCIDALKDLDINENVEIVAPSVPPTKKPLLLAAVLSLLLAFFVGLWFSTGPVIDRWKIAQPKVLPIDVVFNKPIKEFAYGDACTIDVQPRTDSYIYLFNVDPDGSVVQLYPPSPRHGKDAFVKAGETRRVDGFGPNTKLLVGRNPAKLHLVAFESDAPFLSDSDFDSENPVAHPMKIKADELIQRLSIAQNQNPAGVLHSVLDAPQGK